MLLIVLIVVLAGKVFCREINYLLIIGSTFFGGGDEAYCCSQKCGLCNKCHEYDQDYICFGTDCTIYTNACFGGNAINDNSDDRIVPANKLV